MLSHTERSRCTVRPMLVTGLVCGALLTLAAATDAQAQLPAGMMTAKVEEPETRLDDLAAVTFTIGLANPTTSAVLEYSVDAPGQPVFTVPVNLNFPAVRVRTLQYGVRYRARSVLMTPSGRVVSNDVIVEPRVRQLRERPYLLSAISRTKGSSRRHLANVRVVQAQG